MNTDKIEDRELSMDDLARHIRGTRQDALAYVREGKIPHHRRFGNTYIYESDLAAYQMRYHREVTEKKLA